jgi:hypothetical protein
VYPLFDSDPESKFGLPMHQLGNRPVRFRFPKSTSTAMRLTVCERSIPIGQMWYPTSDGKTFAVFELTDAGWLQVDTQSGSLVPSRVVMYHDLVVWMHIIRAWIKVTEGAYPIGNRRGLLKRIRRNETLMSYFPAQCK